MTKTLKTKAGDDPEPEQLTRRYGPGLAQDISEQLRLARGEDRRIDYMDVKAVSELSEKLRAQAMMAVWQLRYWRGQSETAKPLAKIRSLQGAYLERQAHDAVCLYRTAHKLYFALHRQAMAELREAAAA